MLQRRFADCRQMINHCLVLPILARDRAVPAIGNSALVFISVLQDIFGRGCVSRAFLISFYLQRNASICFQETALQSDGLVS